MEHIWYKYIKKTFSHYPPGSEDGSICWPILFCLHVWKLKLTICGSWGLHRPHTWKHSLYVCLCCIHKHTHARMRRHAGTHTSADVRFLYPLEAGSRANWLSSLSVSSKMSEKASLIQPELESAWCWLRQLFMARLAYWPLSRKCHSHLNHHFTLLCQAF